MKNNAIYMLRNKLSKIPFVDILLPYTESFLYKLEKIIVSSDLKYKLHLKLLQELSLIAEVTLQEELNFFKTNRQGNYEQFTKNTNLVIETKYPVLDSILKRNVDNFSKHIHNITSNFIKDFYTITQTFSVEENENIIITDIDTSLGDGHMGESTALVTLSDGTKLIYKPRNTETTNSYNLFIDWINYKLNTDLKTFKCVSYGCYGWIEFITNDVISSAEELREYYYKAGILLAVTLLLGSKDCHYENIIASGRNPVLIDHETIVQPVLSEQSISTWDKQHKIPPFSVLESMLIINQDTGVASEYVGYGTKGKVETIDLEKKVINPNTIDSKREARFVFRKLIKENIPKYENAHVFVNNYKVSFIEGFSNTYDMFLDSRDELMSYNSPIQFFQNLKIRYVWRPTFVYFRILKYIRQASFMSSFEAYELKLYELMSKAYRKEGLENYKLILGCEMQQMISGYIPLFNLNNSYYHLDEDKSFRIFKYNCIDNINHRINLLSITHKGEQIEYITKWLNI